ncbi:MAG TPA: TetR/AcrR family transcriptional regulator [Mesorhizobium sp.]|jgi:AcrR family transcriptional regulator|nr:TetR/AcrR family transcriptional regulator [Mesorhizobium sp.]
MDRDQTVSMMETVLDVTPAPEGTTDKCCGPPLNAKAQRILAGARSAFQELGFEGTSVDEIARRAGVSKPTLYSYFGDKQALFAASFADQCQGEAALALSSVDGTSSDCVETALRDVARRVVAFLVSPSAILMFRSAVAESGRFPALGRTYFETGETTKKGLIGLFHKAIAAGVLAIDDVELAADQFLVLCKVDLVHKQLFLQAEPPSEADINRVAEGAVKLFFDGYRKRN